ncbi:MAG TPA: 23S rRNA (guanosine(2251)-2'-O)-methyltransferase RlmB [Thermosynergistes sp.]|nr:23S rRNA (guanosine(2251)-2'-O)-methyltransferase RlmB [Thermosynergistes sp.]
MRKPFEDGDLCFGRHPVLDLLRADPKRCLKLYLARSAEESFRRRILAMAKGSGIPVQQVEMSFLDRLAPLSVHQGVVARVAPVALLDFWKFVEGIPPLPEPVLVVLLDHVKDPQNLGAIVRTAEACCAAGLLLPKRRAALPTGSVVKASAGAVFRIPIVSIVNVTRAIDDLRELGFFSVGLDTVGGKSLFVGPLPERLLLVIGEESGLSRLAKEHCDEIRRIPMRGKGESLNASVAASIGMYEWFRARESIS